MMPAVADDSPLVANPARVIRVLLGSAGSIALAVPGLRALLQARALSEAVNGARPEFLELGFRSGGIALLAAAQWIILTVIIRALYPVRRSDRMIASVLIAVFTVGAFGAVVFGLTGR